MSYRLAAVACASGLLLALAVPAAAVCDEHPDTCRRGREAMQEVGETIRRGEDAVRDIERGFVPPPTVLGKCDGDVDAIAILHNGSARAAVPYYIDWRILFNGSCTRTNLATCAVVGVGTSSGADFPLPGGPMCSAATNTAPRNPVASKIAVSGHIASSNASPFVIERTYRVVCFEPDLCEAF